MKIELPKTPTFSQKGLDGYVYPLGTKMQINLMDCYDKHENYFTYEKTMVYFVAEGAGRFKIGGKIFDVKAGDMVEIPPNTETTYIGPMKLLLIIQDGYEAELNTDTGRPTDL